MKTAALFFYIVIATTSISQGLILDKNEFKNTKKWVPEQSQGYASEELPTKISYRKYTPPIQDQGDVGTCVGWAVAYAQLSTQQNLQMGITGFGPKICRAMDPYFVYGYISSNGDTWCQNGASMSDAMQVLLNRGTKPFIWDPWLTCNSLVTFSDFTTALASNYVINDYLAVPLDEIVGNVKLALANEFIVSIGVNLTESFHAGSALNSGVWSPSSSEEPTGGHAMCVVGYDDSKFGGAFEVMNSWGTGYGENGFVWIKYKDFKKYVDEAYVIETKDFQKGRCSMGDCYNSYSRYTYDDGTIYEGIVKNGEIDIYGSIAYPNGDFYVGGINEGRKHGYGIYYDFAQKLYYNVQFKNDKYFRGEVKQGYAEEESKLGDLLNLLIGLNTGSKVEDDITKIDDYFQDFEVPVAPMTIRTSTDQK
jgi:hypothetical protein